MASRSLKNSGRQGKVPKVANSSLPPVGAYCSPGPNPKHIKNTIGTSDKKASKRVSGTVSR